MLKLSDRRFRGNLIEVHNMQKQMSSISREIEILKINKKEMLQIKNKSKSVFDGLTSIID